MDATIYSWLVITHLGSASVLMPIFGIAMVGLWRANQYDTVRIWLLMLSFAIAVTLISKIMFLGWGLGIPSLDFTGISGHALLATSVLPVLLSWFLGNHGYRVRAAGAFLGLLVGAVVSVSRVVLGAHSVSEVLIAWMIGLLVSLITLPTLISPSRRPWFIWLSPLILLFAFGTSTSTYMQTHDWEIKIALLLSGHDRPYARMRLIEPVGDDRYIHAYPSRRRAMCYPL